MTCTKVRLGKIVQQKFVVHSTTTLKGNPSKLQSHVCANSKPFTQKIFK